MIISTHHKVCIFLVPRTGTTTIRNIFIDRILSNEVSRNGSFELPPHPNYDDVLPHIPDLATYQMFAFYRDPVERFISAFNYLKGRYSENPEIAPHFDSLESIINSGAYAVDGVRRGLFRPQTHWLNHPGIAPLNFAQYETRLRQVLTRFGIPSDTVIESSNESMNLWTPTQSERNQITELYADDYQFLSDRGLV